MRYIVKLLALCSLLAISIGVVSCISTFARKNPGKNYTLKYQNKDTEGTTTKYVREINLKGDVREINNYCSADIEYSEGTPSLTIEGEKDVVNRVQISFRNNSLVIEMLNSVEQIESPKIKISGNKLNELSLSGSGSFKAYRLTSSSINLKTLGTGDINIETINTASLRLLVQGSGDIEIGKIGTTNFQAVINGMGDIKVGKTEASSFKGVVSGTGDIIVSGLNTSAAMALVHGTGDIVLNKMTAIQFTATVSGTGDIICDGETKGARLTVTGTGDINAQRLKTDAIYCLSQGTGMIYK